MPVHHGFIPTQSETSVTMPAELDLWTIPAPIGPRARRRRLRQRLDALLRWLGATLRATPDLAIRETGQGYSISQPLTLAPLCREDRIARLCVAVATALAAALSWALTGWADLGARVLLSIQSATVAGVVGLVATMRGQLLVDVDLLRRRIRVCRSVRGKGKVLADQPFGSAADLVLQRRRGRWMRLCLRICAAGRQMWQVIAIGEEEVLRGLHRRLSADLAPPRGCAEMGAAGRASRRSDIFPPLGPHELVGPGHRVRTALR